MKNEEPRSHVLRNLSTFLRSKELIFVLRLFLGGLFIYASYDKILRPNQFAIAVRAYKIIPLELSNLFAIAVAWSEMVAGILIFLGLFTRQAASAIFLLLLMFIGAITTSLVRGFAIDCGCFKAGEGGHLVDKGLLFRDILLLFAAYLVIRYERGFGGLHKVLSRGKG